MQFVEICEQSAEEIKNGRVHIKVSALEIHDANDPSSHNRNGIKWVREYIEDNIESAVGMPYVCSFLDNEKTYPSDHGVLTYDENGNAIFENSEVVGYVEKAYIEDIVINNEKKTVMQTEGYLYYQRFPNLVKFLRDMQGEGTTIDSSIEINGKDGRKEISYLNGSINPDGTKKVNRIPVEFSFTGLAILYMVPPGDDCAQVIEINQNESNTDLDENINKEDTSTMAEINNTDSIVELNDRILNQANEINELKSQIDAKEVELTECKKELEDCKAELNSSKEKEAELNELLVEANKSVEANKTEIAELNSELEPLREMKNRIEAEKAQAEVNAYFETIKKENGFSEAELNSLKEEFVDKCDLAGLKAKETELCVARFKEMKKADKVDAEINSAETDNNLFFSTKVEIIEANAADDGSDLF